MIITACFQYKTKLLVSSIQINLIAYRGCQIAYASTSRTHFIGQRTNDFIQTDVNVHSSWEEEVHQYW